jgi:hypothetical protein
MQLIVVLAALSFAQPPPPTAALPLVVERVESLPPEAERTRVADTAVTLFNAGTGTIHAFGIRTQLTLADGKTIVGGASADRYERPEPPTRPSPRGDCGGALAPKRRCTMWTGPDGRRDAVSASGFATFVIFDDNTAAGDEREIEHYFRQRALNHRAWPVIEQVLAEAMAVTPDPLRALFEFRERLARITDGDVTLSHAYQQLDRHLAMNLKMTRPDHAPFLRSIVALVKTRKAAAERHYQRR